MNLLTLGREAAVFDVTGTDNTFGQQPPASADQTMESGTATLRYNARYMATGITSVGTANSNATYTLSYR
ncbi:hypothetical protein FAZ95_25860 [Trinickia violacea]|uniref:Fimbrial protein n=1 Tax=Trinickia violacea TaxID=2571746 RepID=A0A4P8IVY5_9BURK|nr:hypothetical protein [Trinickia violacea]QCP52586.1 hypothetical protein FAZ95_25860 [Trinickia violacea]